MGCFTHNQWALILGGSSGFGLAAAKKMSSEGMSVCVVHRDRRGAMERIEEEFEGIRENGHPFVSVNADALSSEGIDQVIGGLRENMGPDGSLRLLLHSIAAGNLKPIVEFKEPPRKRNASALATIGAISERLGVDAKMLDETINALFEEGLAGLYPLVHAESGRVAVMEDEDVARTVYGMGTNLLTWVQKLHTARLFSDDARVIGITSEGNHVGWPGYAAVSAAKCALESISRSIAVEFGAYGIRSNIIQAGIADTPALRAIPVGRRELGNALLRNPLGRITLPEDVANAVYLLCTDEAGWINGSLIRVDGGEHVSSAIS